MGSDFVMLLENDDTNGVYIESISVTDEAGYTYSVNTYCLESENRAIGRLGDLNINCTDFGPNNGLFEYEEICMDSDSNVCGRTRRVAVEFAKDLFQESENNQEGFVYPISTFDLNTCYPHTTAPTGVPTDQPTVSPITISPTTIPTLVPTKMPSTALVKSFGFYANIGTTNIADGVKLRLLWNSTAYQCIIAAPTDNDTLYLCDTTIDAEVCDFNNYVSPNTYSMTISNENASPLVIDEIIINYDGDYEAKIRINSFCSD